MGTKFSTYTPENTVTMVLDQMCINKNGFVRKFFCHPLTGYCPILWKTSKNEGNRKSKTFNESKWRNRSSRESFGVISVYIPYFPAYKSTRRISRVLNLDSKIMILSYIRRISRISFSRNAPHPLIGMKWYIFKWISYESFYWTSIWL